MVKFQDCFVSFLWRFWDDQKINGKFEVRFRFKDDMTILMKGLVSASLFFPNLYLHMDVCSCFCDSFVSCFAISIHWSMNKGGIFYVQHGREINHSRKYHSQVHPSSTPTCLDELLHLFHFCFSPRLIPQQKLNSHLPLVLT